MSKRKQKSDAEILRHSLGVMGMSQLEAARQLGVDGRTVRRWIAGDVPVPRMALLALSHLADTGWESEVGA